MLDLLQHASLIIGVFNLLHLDHLGFLEHFNGIEALVVLRLHKVDAAEAAGAEGALNGKVLQCVLALCHPRRGLGLGDVQAAIGGLGGLLLLLLLLRLEALRLGIGAGGVYEILDGRHVVRGGLLVLVGLGGGLRGGVGLLRVHRVGGLV